jgi:hypothetical protein
VDNEPEVPFLRYNEYHVLRFDRSTSEGRSLYIQLYLKMRRGDYELGRFKEKAYVMDANCRKFPILDVINLGKSFDIADLIFNQDKVKVKYIFDTPIQLTFEQAREEIVEHICSKTWLRRPGQREGEQKFRERMGMCENMHELIMGRRIYDKVLNRRFHWIGVISHHGDWVG